MLESQIKDLAIDKSSWTPVKFGDVAFEPKESVKNAIKEGIEHVVGLEHIEPEDIHLRRFNSIEESTTFSKKFSPGDVLFGRRRAYLKKAAQAEFTGICSGDITVMRAKENLLPELLPFIVNNEKFFYWAITHSAGGLSPRCKFKDLANYEFLLPPKEQQVEIAELLWAMDEVIQRKLTYHDEIISTYYVILENLILKNGDKENKSTLGSIGKWVSGGTPSKKNASFWTGGETMWVTPKDMGASIINDTQDKLTTEAIVSGRSKVFKSGSTVLVWRSGVLQHTFPIAKVSGDFTVNQDMKVFVPASQDFDPDFVHIFLTINAEKIRRKCVKEGTTVQSINTDSFLGFSINQVPIDKQLEIIKLSSLYADVIRSAKENLINCKSLQKSLINQVF